MVPVNVARVGGAGKHPYVAAVLAEGRFVFVSGQSPTRGGALIQGTIQEQTEVVMENITAILQSAGATLDDVVKCGVFLANLDSLPQFNDAYAGAFGAHLPARTTVGVTLPGYAVEIDCIAKIPDA